MYLTHNGQPIKHCMPIIYTVPADTPEELHDIIIDEVEYWNRVMGKKIFYNTDNMGYSMGSTYLYGVYTIGTVPELTGSSWRTKTCGKTKYDHRNNCFISVRTEIDIKCTEDPNLLRTIVRHEVGHALGLCDRTDITGIMRSSVSKTEHHPLDVTEDEIEALKKLYTKKRIIFKDEN
jgi:hypothetical protein